MMGAGAVRHRESLLIVVVGVAAGVASSMLVDLRLTWLAFVLLAVVFGIALLATADVLRFVGALFVLSLQADAAYRILYGRAGSEGIAFPLCFLVGMAWTGLWLLLGRGRRQSAGPLAKPIALLLSMAGIAWLLSTEKFVGVATLVCQLELFFIFWLALQLVQSRQDLERVVQLLMVALAVQCIVYFVQSALGVSFTLEGDTIEQGVVARPGGTVSSNPAGFASFVIPLLTLATVRFLTSARRGERQWLGVLVVAGVIAVGLTYTRAAWAGLLLAMAVIAISLWRRGQLPPRLVWVGAAVGAMVIVLIPTMALRVEDNPLDEAYAERSGLMEIALEVIRSHPLAGVGPGAYGYVYKQHLPENMPDQWLYTVHNEYLLRTAETGLLGGLAWVLLLITGFRLARDLGRSPSYELSSFGIAWSAGLLALAWQMYWVPWDGFQYNALFWFMLGLSVAATRLRSTDGGAHVTAPVAPR